MNVGGPVRAAEARAVKGAAARRDTRDFQRTPLPDPGGAFLLRAVCDPYAVGATGTGPLILHWNGTLWEKEPLPAFDPALSGAMLTGVAGRVAVGGALDRLTGAETPLLLCRDDTGWVEEKAPGTGFPYVLTGVHGDWAAGHGFPGTVLLHRGLGGWTHLQTPGRPARLLAVASLGRHVWAGGERDREGLLLSFDGRSWKEHRTRTGPVTALAIRNGRPWAAAGRTLLEWTGRRWARHTAPLDVNALSTTASGALCAAGAGALGVHDGRRWDLRALPGTWLGADPVWLVGSA
ncbi:hypothetical protein [Actinocorallia populi]|uniref:hypothetical protein n=1 Tax=Actinocorallia populi TaxID=2079200 RepID=UPI000D0885D8|nr:hypothetical protein [Actinocorallia populi]